MFETFHLDHLPPRPIIINDHPPCHISGPANQGCWTLMTSSSWGWSQKSSNTLLLIVIPNSLGDKPINSTSWCSWHSSSQGDFGRIRSNILGKQSNKLPQGNPIPYSQPSPPNKFAKDTRPGGPKMANSGSMIFTFQHRKNHQIGILAKEVVVRYGVICVCCCMLFPLYMGYITSSCKCKQTVVSSLWTCIRRIEN